MGVRGACKSGQRETHQVVLGRQVAFNMSNDEISIFIFVTLLELDSALPRPDTVSSALRPRMRA